MKRPNQSVKVFSTNSGANSINALANLIDLQAYAGQRVKALCKLPLSQIDITYNELYAVLHIKAHQNKSRRNHECIVPKPLILRILERCKKLNLDCPFPNYEQLWKDITKFAYEFYGIRFTSHYLRKRFSTIASDTPMDVNQWDYLMGSRKAKGHDADTYNLDDLDKLIKSYHTYLAHELSFEKETVNTVTLSNIQDLTQLKEIIKIQQEQIEKLTKALTKS